MSKGREPYNYVILVMLPKVIFRIGKRKLIQRERLFDVRFESVSVYIKYDFLNVSNIIHITSKWQVFISRWSCTTASGHMTLSFDHVASAATTIPKKMMKMATNWQFDHNIIVQVSDPPTIFPNATLKSNSVASMILHCTIKSISVIWIS